MDLDHQILKRNSRGLLNMDDLLTSGTLCKFTQIGSLHLTAGKRVSHYLSIIGDWVMLTLLVC